MPYWREVVDGGREASGLALPAKQRSQGDTSYTLSSPGNGEIRFADKRLYGTGQGGGI